ncbi:hypothetical protein [Nonomuraea turcica]|uniref:hypothetical protein n=1 Tax=Nonomuraea sp. G32 TaxID=3067274 RepID=UPI00273AEFCA|nr:hypothetical protein [Nonomuraea sp. G32]MDP4507554.1 hypothetical protein [Nonomuraea sp. G32]
MAQYTEDDLRTAFNERSRREHGLPPDVTEITRLGGRARRRRRTATAAALAAGALTVGVAILPVLYGNAPGPTSSAQVTSGLELPQTLEGLHRRQVSLIQEETHQSLAKGELVTFKPTSVNTGFSIRCADPQAWVLVRSVHDPGQWTDFGRCGERKGNSLDSQNDAQSVPPGWLERPQSMEIWVFPADAPIGSSAGCDIEARKKGACNAPFDHETLILAPELLANQLGPREGAPWWIGVYDTPR